MKSILLSIRPEWTAKILNKEKTIEIRKKFPKDYVGWVYIYCTKGELLWSFNYNKSFVLDRRYNRVIDNPERLWQLNGKVVARFWCDKVEEISNYGFARRSETMMKNILEKSCLTMEELNEYAPHKDYKENDYIYAIHISKLEVFDRPKELSEFGYYEKNETMPHRQVVKAPQNYCFVESEK